MSLADKLVDGPELKREEQDLRAQDESLAWRGAERFELGAEQELEELPERETTRHEDKDHRGLVLGAMRAILEGQKVVVELLQLPQRELLALEALQEATRAKDTQLDHFVYASDRRDLLEQALGVLQPTLLDGDAHELHGDLEQVTKRVAALRTTLLQKEDAQDELIVGAEVVSKGETEGDDADADADADEVSEDADAPKRSTLGHEDPPEGAPEAPKPKTPKTPKTPRAGGDGGGRRGDA